MIETAEPGAVRVEHDTMGEVSVPVSAYYGAQTARAVTNLPVGSIAMPPPFIHALGIIKGAAAQAHLDRGQIDRELGDAITQASSEVALGRLDDHFPIPVFQTGSGTSSNMNANEVIAARANEILGGARTTAGRVHPNDHVNRGQSSNDIIPTAIHLAVMMQVERQLIPSLQALELGLRRKATEFWPVIKTGRTHLQDATPIRLGQEFLGFADAVRLSIDRIRADVGSLGAVALGGTA